MNKKALNLSVELYPFPGLQTHTRAVSESKATGTPSTRLRRLKVLKDEATRKTTAYEASEKNIALMFSHGTLTTKSYDRDQP